eukprot:GFUD01000987.1.p1 GENE.GFUD01000987.1~~GFUD01000987.1.p1  ORF type:complete len:434 (-),score=96.97 GFUD01000987.1:48-1175(-)
MDDWKEIFARLDPKDGAEDGRICKVTFLEWIDTLNFQDTVMLEVSQGISREKIRWLIEAADTDENKYIDREEFLALVDKHSRELEKIQRNNLLKYMRVAAYADEYRWWPPPFFIILLTLVQITIYIYHCVYFTELGVPITWTGPSPFCSVLIYNPQKRQQFWRFFTYSFVHSGVEHILVNIVLQLLVGLALEMSNSWWRVGLVYVLGVIAGSLATSVINPGTFLAGASGGVYAIACAHLAAILLNWKEDSLILRQRMRNKKVSSPTFGKVVRVGRVLVVGGILCVDAVTAISSSLSGEVNTTSYTAHVAGVAMGMLVGVVMLKNRRVQFWEQWLRAACCVLAGTFILVMIVVNIFMEGIFLPMSEEDPACSQYAG